MTAPTPIRCIIVMGVSGSGKTTVGQALAARLGWDFQDADDFHPPENIAKMASGTPLTDADRAPWLAALHDLLVACLAAGRPAVLACSALKQRYREQLLSGHPRVKWVYLHGSYDLIWARMVARPDHYMQPHMLQSQFAALEPPGEALVVEIDRPVEVIVGEIVSTLRPASKN